MKLVITVFAIAQTLLYACLYYIFPATLLEWEASTLWSRVDITLALTLAITSSAICSPVMGLLLDKGKGAITISGGVLLGGLLLWCLQYNLNLSEFYLIWIGIGIAMSSCLYEPVFTYIIKYRGDSAKKDITTITLVAGFASTLCFPSVTYGLSHFSLSSVFIIASLLLLGLVAPLYLACCYLQKHRVKEATIHQAHTELTNNRNLLTIRPFWLLAVSFSLLGLVHAVIINHLLPLLNERSLSIENAVLIISLIGPMQVIGRVISIFADKKFNIISVTLGCFVGLNLALFTLLIAGDNMSLLLLFVLFQGASYGVISIMKPLVIKHFMGKNSLGMISGWLALPYLLCTAIAPYLGSTLWQISGYYLVLLFMVVLSSIALISFSLLTSKQNQLLSSPEMTR